MRRDLSVLLITAYNKRQALKGRSLKIMYTIYHNPRCSKSRQALEILQKAKVEIEIVRYLEQPLNEEQLRALLDQLSMTADQLIRKGEDEFKQLKKSVDVLSEKQIIQAMVNNPKLIERPIVVAGNNAIVGRPPENIRSLLP